MSDSSLFDLDAFGAASSTAETLAETPSQRVASAPVAGTQPASQTQSLYRKYRPQTFNPDEFFGQQHIVHTLRSAIALDRVAHAYLFCGPRGTGKTTTARLMAKAVNCEDPDPFKRPCNVCSSCVAISRNATTDVIEIDAASNRGIDDIRDLRERVKYAPTQLRTKFYIIDEAHQITGAAANAFLKTLEEPPAHTRFVLATTDPEELLQTIVSRCQRFDFRRIDLEAMTLSLRRIAGLEGIAIDDEAITAIARHATGSLRDAQGLLDQVSVYREDGGEASGSVTVDTVRLVLGVSRNDRVEALAAALADHDPALALRTINAAVEDGDDVRQLGRQLTAYLRVLLHERAGGSADADEIARRLASRFSLAALTELTRLFVDIDYKIKHSAFPQLPLELALVDGATMTELSSASGSSIDARRERLQSTEDVAPVQRPESPVPDEAVRPASPRPSLRDRVRGEMGGAATATPPTSRPPTRYEHQAPATRAPEPPRSNQTERSTRIAETPSSPVSMPDSVMPGADSVQRPPTAPDGRSNSSTPSLESIVDLWAKIRADVKAVNRRIEALLQQVDPAAVTGSRLILTSAYEFHRNRVNTDDARMVIEDVIERIIGQRMQVSCVSREEAAALKGGTGSRATPHVADQPEPSPSASSASAYEAAPEASPPGSTQRSNDDETRINAAKNIFDAEVIEDR